MYMTNEEKLSELIENTTTELLSNFLPEAISLGATPEVVANLASAISYLSSSHDNFIDEDAVYQIEAELTSQIEQLQETVAELEMELSQQDNIQRLQPDAASKNGRIKERISARRRGFGA